MKNKRGNILIENILFLILNLVFFSILILFVFSKTGNTADIEEQYAKQIALMIDNAKPGMIFKINMQNAKEKAEKNEYYEKIIQINKNIVTIKLKEKGGYSYSFFNDVEVTEPYEIINKNTNQGTGYYYFSIKEK